MDKKKIILLTDGYPYGYGENFLDSEIKYLSNWFNITIVTIKSHDYLRVLPKNVKVIDLSVQINKFSFFDKFKNIIKFLFSKEGIEELSLILKTKKNVLCRIKDSMSSFHHSFHHLKVLEANGLINNFENIILYSYWFNYKLIAIAFKKNRYSKLQIITRLHGYDLYNERNRFGRQPFRNQVDKYLDRIIFVSQFGKDYYCNTFKSTSSKKYILSRIGTENDFGLAPYEHGKRSLVIVSCSNVILLKRIDLIIRGLSLIDDLPIKWFHFGEGDQMVQIKELAAKLFSNRPKINYHFFGQVKNEQIHIFYQKNFVDCFITTSSTEGGNPISIQEAMSYGIPIIATEVGGITEMITTNGILLSENPKKREIADAIREIYEMPLDVLIEKRKASRLDWEQRFMASKNNEKFRLVIDGIE